MKSLIALFALTAAIFIAQAASADSTGLQVCKQIDSDLPQARSECFRIANSARFDVNAAAQCARFDNLPDALIECLEMTANRSFDVAAMNSCPSQSDLPLTILHCVKRAVR